MSETSRITTPTIKKIFDVLLVEDSPEDALIIKKGLHHARASLRIHHVHDGAQALDILLNENHLEANLWRPDIVILDLNLPKKSGREILQVIRKSDRLTHLPIIILSTSSSPDDIRASYRLHANSYFKKPEGFQEFVDLLTYIDRYWLSHAILPPPDDLV